VLVFDVELFEREEAVVGPEQFTDLTEIKIKRAK
jgi:hypothetical protein